jgi:hypothetical protein
MNLEKASIKLNALSLTNIFGSSDDISLLFKLHYLQLVKANLFRLVGQTNLLGNPVNFVG